MSNQNGVSSPGLASGEGNMVIGNRQEKQHLAFTHTLCTQRVLCHRYWLPAPKAKLNFVRDKKTKEVPATSDKSLPS